ncbi:MAG: SDR family NAD(P)-dependent oxidoreductase [Desulfobulbaceae bacterium]|nr:SDR family NAD(P)-dependent oxidoreductase [Desulfobulbaceae bacterium]
MIPDTPHSKFSFFASTFPGFPDPSLAIACSRAGGCGICNLEFETDTVLAKTSIAKLARYTTTPFGVKLRALPDQFLCELISAFSDRLSTVILRATDQDQLEETVNLLRPLKVSILLECTSLEEAELGQRLRVDGLIAKGHEAGGRVAHETTFILLQRFLSHCSLPIYAHGGIGLHSAAGCYAAGAAGVILDAQLALTRESPLADELKTRITRMDGRETILVGRPLSELYRLWLSPGSAALDDLREIEEKCVAQSESHDTLKAQWHQALSRSASQGYLLFLGQDIGFAHELATRYVTVAGVLQAMEKAIEESCQALEQTPILSEQSAMARSHGTRYPLVQGPMARVSDTPSFAHAIAGSGSLAFIAAAWLREKELDPLLKETGAQLAGQSWGVGLLGFLPAEVYKEQRDVVCRYRPPFALIAGGRPAQVKDLEQEGIATYVHVPTLGLLSMFLDAGLTRFVFEGREAGGHVGPLTSFVLWEMMINKLLLFLDKGSKAENYHILFAGGIKDGLSSAIVAAMAAPLAKRGVRIGLQLGSAYLFTEEAVATGAIVKRFQDEIIKCRQTILLETAPGHAVRCANSPFTRTFLQERQRLQTNGKTVQEIRSMLEKLEKGRLRVASKGISVNPAHKDDPDVPRLITINEEEQFRQGEYMIGELAALQSSSLTLDALHQEIIARGAGRLTQKSRPPVVSQAEPEQQPSDIAIIGMSCFFPQAENVAQYWSNIVNKINTIREIPKERWDWQRYFDADRQAPDKIYSKWGTFLDDVPFDPLQYGMPPKGISSVEPLHLISLETVRFALEDAGYSNRPFCRDSTAVFYGVSGSGELGQLYGFRTMLPMFFGEASSDIINHFSSTLPEWTEDSFPGILMNVAAGRIANRFDLGGANALLDAACASSLAALYLGVKELETRSCDMALVGSTDCMQNPFTYMCFSKTQALSPRGICNSLDQGADGIVIGEGSVMFVLKRLDDAERDGDKIYSVIKGMGASSDGRDRSLTAPGVKGQMRALKRAYAKSGISPVEVELAEAHATGTVAGDKVEIESLSTVYKQAGASPKNCAIGSVKSMIGHTKSAAGLASLMKIVLALHHKVLPPTLGVEKPNKGLLPSDSPFYANTQTRPWLTKNKEKGRKAVVSAFGFGGTNYHAVVQEYQGDHLGMRDAAPFQKWPSELFFWHGGSAEEIVEQVQALQDKLSPALHVNLGDLAYTCALASKAGKKETEKKCSLALVAASLDDLRAKLATAREKLSQDASDIVDPRGIYFSAKPLYREGKVAFVFPGQGSQYVNMLADLAVQFPFIRKLFERSDIILEGILDAPLSATIFPADVFTDDEKKAQKVALAHTRHAQPALGTADLAILHLLRLLNIQPDMTAGHSYGEYVALCAAGVMAEDDLILLSEARARFILEGAGDNPGTMAAVQANLSEVEKGVQGLEGVWIANLNSPRQSVITGTSKGIKAAVERFSELGIKARPIPVSCAFHSPLMEPACAKLEEFLAGISFNKPCVPVYSNTTASVHSEDGLEIKKVLVRHLINKVEFVKQINEMYEQGARIFIEVGPGRVMSSLVQQIIGDRPHLAASANLAGRSGFSQLHHLMAQLICHGVPVQPEQLNTGRKLKKLDLDNLSTSPYAHLSPTTWLVNGAGVRPLKDQQKTGGHADITPYSFSHTSAQQETASSNDKICRMTDNALSGSGPTGAVEGKAQAMFGFQKMMQQFLASQNNVMMNFLQSGTPIGPTVPHPTGKVCGQTAPCKKKTKDAAHLLPRFLLNYQPISLPQQTRPLDKGKTVLITDDNQGIAAAVSTLLRDQGYKTALLGHGKETKSEKQCFSLPEWTEENIAKATQEIENSLGPVGSILHLFPLQKWPAFQDMNAEQWQSRLHSEQASLFFLLQCCQQSIRQTGQEGGAVILCASSMGGTAGLDPATISRDYFPGHGALGGFAKTLALEWPEVRCRSVDLSPGDGMEAVAAALVTECTADDGLVQVGYRNGSRLAPALVETSLASRKTEPCRPESSWVIVVTGGARGITATISADIAKRYQPTLILAGRSPMPAEKEGEETCHLSQTTEIKKALIEKHKKSGKAFQIGDIEKECAQIVKDREIRAHLAQMRQYGATVSYQQLDVRNEDDVAAFLKKTYDTYGRLDGVIHGAGIIEDKLFNEKKWQSFSRVVSTKTDGAYFLSKYLKPDSLQFFAFFTSVAGSFGNIGQCDYAAANEIVNKLALYLDKKWPDVHLFSLNWGPWAGSGMATDEVQKQFQERQVELIGQADGALTFHEEMILGSKGEVELVVGDGPWRFVACDESSRKTGIPLPFFQDILLPLRSDGSLVLRKSLDLANDLYLRDHCLDGKGVVPAAMAVELMAEAALAGRRGWHLIAVKKIRVLKGIVLDSEQKMLTITVSSPRKGPSEGDIRLEVKISDGQKSIPHYSGTVCLGKAPVKAAKHALPQANSLAPWGMTVQQSYDKWLFHGPLFQCIDHFEGCTEKEIVARLTTSSPQKCLAGHPAGHWLTDPVVLDGGLQMALLWARKHCNITVLPSSFKGVLLYRPLHEADELVCHLQVVERVSKQSILYNMFFTDRQGTLFAMIDRVEATGSRELNRLVGHQTPGKKV